MSVNRTPVEHARELLIVAATMSDIPEYAVRARALAYEAAIRNEQMTAAAPDLLKALRIAIADSCGGCGDEECVPCRTLERATGEYREPTSAQLEAMNNPDSGPSVSHYRDTMRDAGRGGMIR